MATSGFENRMFRLVPSPAKACKVEGWWTKTFLGEDNLIYERRRRKGSKGTYERWLLVTELRVGSKELPNAEGTLMKTVEPHFPAKPGDEAGIFNILTNMALDITEEIEFAIVEVSLSKEQIKLLWRMRSRAGEIHKIASGLMDCPLVLNNVAMTTIH